MKELNKKEEVKELLLDHEKSRRKVFDKIYPKLKDKTDTWNDVNEYIFIDEEFEMVWLLDVLPDFGRDLLEPIPVAFEHFVDECFRQLEEKCLEDKIFSDELFSFTFICKNAYEGLQPVLQNIDQEIQKDFESFLADICFYSYIGKITSQFKNKDYESIEFWFFKVVTKVFSKFAPQFGVVE